jgi:hypothetical protein
VTSAGEADSNRLPRGIPWPSTTTIHFVPLPRLVLPTHAPLFLPERNCRPRRLRSSPTCLWRPTPPERCATHPAKPLALPTSAVCANRCSGWDTAQGDLASERRCAGPKECLQRPVDCASKGGPCWKVEAAADQSSPTACLKEVPVGP